MRSEPRLRIRAPSARTDYLDSRSRPSTTGRRVYVKVDESRIVLNTNCVCPFRYVGTRTTMDGEEEVTRWKARNV